MVLGRWRWLWRWPLTLDLRHPTFDHQPFTFILNCCKKCNNHFAIQFSLVKHILYMSGYSRFIALKQFDDDDG